MIVSAAAYTAGRQGRDRARRWPSRSTARRRGRCASRARARRSAHPSLDRLCLRRHQGRALCRGRSDRSDRRLRRIEARRRAGRACRARDSAVLRTAWVYSPFGSEFVKTMLRLAGERDEIAVVADQRGNPTSALDIADGILARRGEPASRTTDRDCAGIFHMTAPARRAGPSSPRRSSPLSAELGGPTARVQRITTAEYPTPARRPANSRLDCAKLARVHGVRLPRLAGIARNRSSTRLRAAGAMRSFESMKGIILAGGSGTRLYPMTLAVSKQLLPVYDKPMIYYPLTTLMLAGIRDVLVITTPHDRRAVPAAARRRIAVGHEHLLCRAARAEGLAQAFIIGADFVAGGPSCLVLGDNIFFGHGLSDVLAARAAADRGRDGLRLSRRRSRALRRGRVRRARCARSASRRSRRSRSPTGR